MENDILSFDPAYWRSELISQELDEEDVSEFLRSVKSGGQYLFGLCGGGSFLRHCELNDELEADEFDDETWTQWIVMLLSCSFVLVLIG
jgi:hypothetical protein